MNILQIRDALAIIRTGKPFTLIVCQLDIKRETGGERKTYVHCILSGSAGSAKQSGAGTKNPSHRANKTLNILTKSGDVVTVHPSLFESLNGQRIAI